MKKLISTILFFFAPFVLFGQDITGQWNGILKVQGVQLRLVFHVNKAENGYTSTMDSPDQNANGIPVTTTTFENQVLKFTVANAGIAYEGTLGQAGTVAGTFKQGGQSFSLDLTREVFEKKGRPQEPVKPYPYYSEEVVFENTKAGIQLAGTLTLPKQGGSNYPAVVLITGSGAQNRDEELLGHKPFLVLSDYLTRNGIAVLRFDDRGTASSKGDFKSATSKDFAEDVEAALKFLNTRKEIDKNQIGLTGHSEGGTIAQMVAAKDKNLAFIVLLAGVGIPGDELLLRQSELIGRASGLNEEHLKWAKKVNTTVYSLVKKSTNDDSLKRDLREYLNKEFKGNPNSGKPAAMSDDDFVSANVNELTKPWLQYFIKYDPTPALEKVRCPVLAINGEKDLQVPAQVNLEAIRKAIEKGGNKNVTTKELPGLNHLFQESKTGLPAEYGTIEQTISPAALDVVTKWILEVVK